MIRSEPFRRTRVTFQNAVDKAGDYVAARSVSLLRIAIGIIFLWFGALKLFPGGSPAEALAGKTILILTFGVVKPWISVPLLGVLECVIGASFVTAAGLRTAIVLLLFQMAGTLTPLVLLPHDTFTAMPFEPNLTGQYILKNLVLIAGAVVIASNSRFNTRTVVA